MKVSVAIRHAWMVLLAPNHDLFLVPCFRRPLVLNRCKRNLPSRIASLHGHFCVIASEALMIMKGEYLKAVDRSSQGTESTQRN